MKFTAGGLAILATAFLNIGSTSAVVDYGQCGGIGWTGDTTCNSGSTCAYINDYYYQCLPGKISCNSQNGTCTNGGCGSKKSVFWDIGCSPGMYCCV
ncbi:hypothetical protein DL96DRAFT_677 [Flagelloscypha sp. PMI_526]|nr:hypothetical protein DL96DRAFT_677 [Flagelloscypha sp. PMI_526]